MADKFGNLTSDTKIPIFDNEEEVEKVSGKFKDRKPEAFLVYHRTGEFRDENNIDKINSRVECTLILYYRVKESFGRENLRIQDEIQLKNDVLNALYTDRSRDSNATELVVDGEAIWGTEVGEAETDSAKAPIYKIKIPVTCVFQHTATGR